MSFIVFRKNGILNFFLNGSIYIVLTQRFRDFTATGFENYLEIALAKIATFNALKVIINQTHMTKM